ncbi:hypothetical protein BDV96DRAFT_594677 [Lophiotrema nucula]|uniref:C2H2 type master regulator of conidiophore development brlA n=1 Tax=Lophiotrema nucula TaxID=690887 RepID=A0A6A5ZTA5_9PLEO|nr:hypothetical protein BDV96DRAFT_594677 [Lophiotrema nucula]
MSTPPFNSPYQQAMKASSALLQQPAYPSPARSDSEPSKYPSDGLGLYSYSQQYAVSGPPSAALYPPSPQPTEAWAHLTTGASPLMPEGSVDSWTTAFEQPQVRSPLPWTPHHGSHRSSLSSTREMSIFSGEGSEHDFPQIKLEGGSDWDGTSPAMRQQPLTVSPDRLTTNIYSYEHTPYGSPSISKFEATQEENFNSIAYRAASYDQRSRSPLSQEDSTGVTPRTRTRRNHTTRENAQYSCHICNKMFQRNYNYKTHMETHNPTRRREHVCLYKDCDKTFVRKTDLDRHQNSVHRKLKVFRCIRCDNRFARKDTLRRHEEDGCSKRNELRSSDILSQRASMRIVQQDPRMHYYQTPRPDVYEPRSPPLFRDDSFPGSPSDY